MRIGIITGEFPPMEGGVGDYTRELSTALVQLGHNIQVFTSRCEYEHIPNDQSRKIAYRINKWSFTQSYPAIQRWLRATATDIVNVQYQAAAYQMKGAINFVTKWLSITNGPPTIVTYHDLLPPYLFPKAGSLRDWSVKYLAQNANGIIVTNEADRRKLLEVIGSTRPPIELIPIGSNIPTKPPNDFNPHDWRKKYDVEDHDILLGFFGFMNRSKGVDILLSAVSKMHHDGYPVKLVFIGGRTGTSDITNAEYAKHIDARLEEEGIGDIVFRTGFVSPAEVSAALLSIDMCTLPYLEGASLRHGTLHAALTHGCAIITTMSSEVNPKLAQGSVLLIPPNDISALIDAIVLLWKNQQQRVSLQRKAMILSQSFGWENIAMETAAFFQKCIG